MKFNLKQKCLLDASGELSARARAELLEKVKIDPIANAEYERARENFGVFGAMALPEPSAAERKYIPAMIKRAIHGALSQHEKRAGRMQVLLGCAAGVVLAGCVAVFGGYVARHNLMVRQQTQVAHIHAMIERVTMADAGGAGVSPLVITTPSENEENGMGAVAVVPEQRAEMSRDASAPPGSF